MNKAREQRLVTERLNALMPEVAHAEAAARAQQLYGKPTPAMLLCGGLVAVTGGHLRYEKVGLLPGSLELPTDRVTGVGTRGAYLYVYTEGETLTFVLPDAGAARYVAAALNASRNAVRV